MQYAPDKAFLVHDGISTADFDLRVYVPNMFNSFWKYSRFLKFVNTA